MTHARPNALSLAVALALSSSLFGTYAQGGIRVETRAPLETDLPKDEQTRSSALIYDFAQSADRGMTTTITLPPDIFKKEYMSFLESTLSVLGVSYQYGLETLNGNGIGSTHAITLENGIAPFRGQFQLRTNRRQKKELFFKMDVSTALLSGSLKNQLATELQDPIDPATGTVNAATHKKLIVFAAANRDNIHENYHSVGFTMTEEEISPLLAYSKLGDRPFAELKMKEALDSRSDPQALAGAIEDSFFINPELMPGLISSAVVSLISGETHADMEEVMKETVRAISPVTLVTAPDADTMGTPSTVKTLTAVAVAGASDTDDEATISFVAMKGNMHEVMWAKQRPVRASIPEAEDEYLKLPERSEAKESQKLTISELEYATLKNLLQDVKHHRALNDKDLEDLITYYAKGLMLDASIHKDSEVINIKPGHYETALAVLGTAWIPTSLKLQFSDKFPELNDVLQHPDFLAGLGSAHQTVIALYPKPDRELQDYQLALNGVQLRRGQTLVQEYQQNEEEIARYNILIKQQEEQIKEQEEHNKKLREGNTRLAGSPDEQDAEIAKLKEKKATLESELEKSLANKKSLEAATTQNAPLSAEFIAIQQRLAQTQKTLESREEELKKTTTEKETLTATLKEETGKIEQQEQQISDLKQQIEALTQEVSQLLKPTDEMDPADAEWRSKRSAALAEKERQLKFLTDVHHQLQQKNNELQNKASVITNQLQAASESEQKLTEQVDRFKTELGLKNKKLAEQSEQLASQDAKIQTLKDSLAKSQSLNKANTEEINKLENNISDKEQQLAAATHCLAEAIEEVRELKARRDQLADQTDASDRDQLADQTDASDRDIRKRLDSALYEQYQFAQANAKLRNDLNKLKQSYADLEEASVQYQQQIEYFEEEIKRLNGDDPHQVKKPRQALKHIIESGIEELKILQRQIEENTLSIDEIDDDIRGSEDRSQALQESINQIEDDPAKAQKLEALMRNKATVDETTDELKQQSLFLKDRSETARKRVAEITEELAETGLMSAPYSGPLKHGLGKALRTAEINMVVARDDLFRRIAAYNELTGQYPAGVNPADLGLDQWPDGNTADQRAPLREKLRKIEDFHNTHKDIGDRLDQQKMEREQLQQDVDHRQAEFDHDKESVENKERLTEAQKCLTEKDAQIQATETELEALKDGGAQLITDLGLPPKADGKAKTLNEMIGLVNQERDVLTADLTEMDKNVEEIKDSIPDVLDALNVARRDLEPAQEAYNAIPGGDQLSRAQSKMLHTLQRMNSNEEFSDAFAAMTALVKESKARGIDNFNIDNVPFDEPLVAAAALKNRLYLQNTTPLQSAWLSRIIDAAIKFKNNPVVDPDMGGDVTLTSVFRQAEASQHEVHLTPVYELAMKGIPSKFSKELAGLKEMNEADLKRSFTEFCQRVDTNTAKTLQLITDGVISEGFLESYIDGSMPESDRRMFQHVLKGNHISQSDLDNVITAMDGNWDQLKELIHNNQVITDYGMQGASAALHSFKQYSFSLVVGWLMDDIAYRDGRWAVQMLDASENKLRYLTANIFGVKSSEMVRATYKAAKLSMSARITPHMKWLQFTAGVGQVAVAYLGDALLLMNAFENAPLLQSMKYLGISMILDLAQDGTSWHRMVSTIEKIIYLAGVDKDRWITSALHQSVESINTVAKIAQPVANVYSTVLGAKLLSSTFQSMYANNQVAYSTLSGAVRYTAKAIATPSFSRQYLTNLVVAPLSGYGLAPWATGQLQGVAVTGKGLGMGITGTMAATILGSVAIADNLLNENRLSADWTSKTFGKALDFAGRKTGLYGETTTEYINRTAHAPVQKATQSLADYARESGKLRPGWRVDQEYDEYIAIRDHVTPRGPWEEYIYQGVRAATIPNTFNYVYNKLFSTSPVVEKPAVESIKKLTSEESASTSEATERPTATDKAPAEFAPDSEDLNAANKQYQATINHRVSEL